MNTEERKEYVKYRIDSAHKTFEAAKVLASNGFWNSAVNRLYYSVFYAVNALLVINEINTKSHSSTKSQFSLHFIKTGKIEKKYGRLLSELFDWRQKGDRDREVSIEAPTTSNNTPSTFCYIFRTGVSTPLNVLTMLQCYNALMLQCYQ